MSDHHKEPFKFNTPELDQIKKKWDRRNFLTKTSLGIGAVALGSLIGKNLLGKAAGTLAAEGSAASLEEEILRAIPHFAPKAKRVVYLFMSGGPSQIETFDSKPK